ncbi:MAG: hypothetical protein M0Z40_12325 [Actinomycetota bacterium]|jgi:hypothetical protein|nr:hypothetical protein [Actinomycetota bacterium]MDA8075992.1 hypothetical protein [Actinomycetota bacterium]
MPVVTATRPATLSEMELVLSLSPGKPWSKARNGPTPSRRDLGRLEAFEECLAALAWARSLRS